MTSLREHAQTQFAEHESATANYVLTGGSELTPDAALLNSARAAQAPRVPARVETFDQEAYLSLVRNGTPLIKAARMIGADPLVVRRTAKNNKAFAEALELAEEEAAEPIEERLYELAKLGEIKPAQDWLKKRMHSRWGDDPVQVNHEHTGTVTHFDATAPIIDQINALQKALSQRPDEQPHGAVIDAEIVED